VPFADPPRRLLEENLWRATRFGLDGRFIDLDRAVEIPARAAIESLLAWTAPARAEHAIEPALPERNGAQRQRAAFEGGADLAEVYAAIVAETRQSYAYPQEVPAP
jgi:glutamate---cysteine ligase / carboxylate-amine ligase